MVNRKKLFGILFLFLLFKNHFVHAGGITGDGQYHYLAEEEEFGDSTFYVNKNVTVFENGGVLQENWEWNGSNWNIYLDYWYSTASLSGKPINGDSTEVISGISKQSDLTIEMIQNKFRAYDTTLVLSLPLLRADVYDAGKDANQPACVLIPGYTMGIFKSNKESNGWNNGGGMTSSDSSIIRATSGFNGPVVVISYNSHKEYDGKNAADSGEPESEFGILWNGGKGDSTHDGAVDKAVSLLDKMNVLLDGSRLVSHSTGHYLAMKILNRKKVAEYWALSPNTRGSTMIYAVPILLQDYGSWEDMRRDNYGTTGVNLCIKEVSNLTLAPGSPTQSNILLSHGDAMTGGQGEVLDVIMNMGVLSYSDLQQADNLIESQSRRKFLKYEALNNLKDVELRNLGNYKITVWDARKSLLGVWNDLGLTEKIAEEALIQAILYLLGDIKDLKYAFEIYLKVNTVMNIKEIVGDAAKPLMYLSIDIMEHMDLEDRLEVIKDTNAHTRLGAQVPAWISSLAWDPLKMGMDIKWKEGIDNDFDSTDGYEIVRRIEGDKYYWNIGQTNFGKFDYTDNLELEIYKMEPVNVDNTKITFMPYRDEYTENSLAGKWIIVRQRDGGYTGPYEIYANKDNVLWCSYNLAADGIRSQEWRQEHEHGWLMPPQGDKFIIRGVNYEYSVWTWGVNGNNLDKNNKGVFLSVSSNSKSKLMGNAKPPFKKWNGISFYNKLLSFNFEAIDEEFGITLARYRVEGGDWFNLVPKDGAYDEFKEEFDTAVSVSGLGLSQGSHKIDVAIYNALGEKEIYDTTFLLDTTPPSIAENFSPRGGKFTEPPVITFNASDTLSGMKEARVIIMKGDTTYDSGMALLIGTTYTYTSHVIESGGYTYRIEAEDNAGNVASKENWFAFEIP
ncbi:MAG: hypothetical protein AB1414_15425, partial [bacterium]